MFVAVIEPRLLVETVALAELKLKIPITSIPVEVDEEVTVILPVPVRLPTVLPVVLVRPVCG